MSAFANLAGFLLAVSFLPVTTRAAAGQGGG